MVRGECRRLDQIRGPQRSSLLSDPESFFPHINLAFDSPGRTHMESQPWRTWFSNCKPGFLTVVCNSSFTVSGSYLVQFLTHLHIQWTPIVYVPALKGLKDRWDMMVPRFFCENAEGQLRFQTYYSTPFWPVLTTSALTVEFRYSKSELLLSSSCTWYPECYSQNLFLFTFPYHRQWYFVWYHPLPDSILIVLNILSIVEKNNTKLEIVATAYFIILS